MRGRGAAHRYGVMAFAVAAGLILGPAAAQTVNPRAYGAAPTRDGVAPGGADTTNQRLLQNQAALQATLEDLRTDLQVTQVKVDDLALEVKALVAQLEALRDAIETRAEARAVQPADGGGFPALARSAGAAAQPEAPRGAPPPPMSASPSVVAGAPAGSPAGVTPAPPLAVPPPRPAPTAPVAAASDRPSPAAPPPVVAEASEDAFAVYESALNDYHSQNYGLAREAFTEFLQRYPTHTYANNAQFYIGQCYYAEGAYQQAIDAYREVVERYPRGTKVPSALVKMAFAQERLGNTAEAKRLLQQVVETYPFSSDARLAKDKLNRL